MHRDFKECHCLWTMCDRPASSPATSPALVSLVSVIVKADVSDVCELQGVEIFMPFDRVVNA